MAPRRPQDGAKTAPRWPQHGTGSSRVGKLILKQAADKVQRVTMELSGHSPFIVFKDADIKKATDMAIAAKFRNNGQVCISPNRFYIQEEKKDEFVNLFVEKTKKLKIGNGMDPDIQLGPLTTQKRLNEVEALVEKTKKEGVKRLGVHLSFVQTNFFLNICEIGLDLP